MGAYLEGVELYECHCLDLFMKDCTPECPGMEKFIKLIHIGPKALDVLNNG